MITVAGVDPGKTGGIAVIDGDGTLVLCVKMPVIKVKNTWCVDAKAFSAYLTPHGIGIGYVEAVHAMPLQGSVSTFNFGRSYGAAEFGVQCNTGEIKRITPKAWKKYFDVPADKEITLAMATSAFGSDKYWSEVGPKGGFKAENYGRAEAALIALYGWETENGVE